MGHSRTDTGVLVLRLLLVVTAIAGFVSVAVLLGDAGHGTPRLVDDRAPDREAYLKGFAKQAVKVAKRALAVAEEKDAALDACAAILVGHYLREHPGNIRELETLGDDDGEPTL